VYNHRNELAVKFLALAEKYPDDPVALDALTHAVWQVTTLNHEDCRTGVVKFSRNSSRLRQSIATPRVCQS
jgi:hypothetical protein